MVVGIGGFVVGARRVWAPGITGASARPSDAAPARWTRLTFQRGIIGGARHAPDGASFVYAASWDGRPLAIMTSVPGNPHGRALGIDDADLLAISPQGELLLQMHPHGHLMRRTGTLARAPLAGGAPREELSDVQSADYAPDAQQVAVIRATAARSWVEFPIGTALVETTFGWYSDIRVAPAGDRVAVVEHPVALDDQGYVAVVARDGRLRRLGPRWSSIGGLAWAPGGGELWFTASAEGGDRQLHAVTLTGDVRVLASVPAGVRLGDVRADGVVLAVHETIVDDAYGDLDGDGDIERFASYAGLTGFEVSPDGRWQVAVDGSGALSGGVYGIYLVPTGGGGAPVRIGDGLARGFSPDGRTLLAISQDRRHARLLPVGTGTSRELDLHDLHDLDAVQWLPDGERVVLTATGADGIERLWLVTIAGGAPIPFAAGHHMGRIRGRLVRPDGTAILLTDAAGGPTLVPLDGGPPRPLPPLPPGEQYLQWIDDAALLAGPAMLDLPFPTVMSSLYVFELASGKRRPWRQLEAPAVAVAGAPLLVHLSADGARYMFNVASLPGALYRVEGLR